MLNVSTRWVPWAGAAATAAAADYADMKFQPVSGNVTNGELVGLAAIAADVFGYGGRWRTAVQAASDWAVGNFAATFVRGRITPPATVTTTAAAPGANAALAGIPASSGSAAYDLPTGGY